MKIARLLVAVPFVSSSFNNDQRRENVIAPRTFSKTLAASKSLVTFCHKSGTPGISVAVSKGGKIIYATGVGCSDVENLTKCTRDSVFRIASISKSITAVIAAKLMDQGKLDLDKNILEYIPNYPVPRFEGKDSVITCRQLLSHTSGIRHYVKKEDIDRNEKDKSHDLKPLGDKEFLLNKQYDKVCDALELFKNDELLCEPGTKFNYTTHGFCLLSHVLEEVSKENFDVLIKKLFIELGMNESYIDVNDKIIRNRAKFYKRNGKGLENTPEVNNSYKIAGGGILSTSTDLLKFGNAVLNSFNGSIDDKHALLTKETATNLFSNQTAKMDNFYCLGFVNYPFNGKYSGEQSFKRSGYWYHTGAGSGACSILLIKPDENGNKENDLVVALLVNLQDCSGSLTNLALEIAEIFNSA